MTISPNSVKKSKAKAGNLAQIDVNLTQIDENSEEDEDAGEGAEALGSAEDVEENLEAMPQETKD